MFYIDTFVYSREGFKLKFVFINLKSPGKNLIQNQFIGYIRTILNN